MNIPSTPTTKQMDGILLVQNVPKNPIQATRHLMGPTYDHFHDSMSNGDVDKIPRSIAIPNSSNIGVAPCQVQQSPEIANKCNPSSPVFGGFHSYETPDAMGTTELRSWDRYCSSRNFKTTPVTTLDKSTSLLYNGPLVEEELLAKELCQSISQKHQAQALRYDNNDSMLDAGGFFFLVVPDPNPASRAGSRLQSSRCSSASNNQDVDRIDDSFHSVDPIIPSVTRLLPSGPSSSSDSLTNIDEFFQNTKNVPNLSSAYNQEDVATTFNRPTSRQCFIPISILPRTTPLEENDDEDKSDDLSKQCKPSFDPDSSSPTCKRRIIRTKQGSRAVADQPTGFQETLRPPPPAPLLSPTASYSSLEKSRAVSMNSTEDTPRQHIENRNSTPSSSNVAKRHKKTNFNFNTVKLHIPTPVRVQGYHHSAHKNRNKKDSTPSDHDNAPKNLPSLGGFYPKSARAVSETQMIFPSFETYKEIQNKCSAAFVPTFNTDMHVEAEERSNDVADALNISGHNRYHSMLNAIHCYSPCSKYDDA